MTTIIGRAWASQTFNNFTHLSRASSHARPLVSEGRHSKQFIVPPNLLISKSSNGMPSALWLLHRPDSVLGIVVRPQSDGPCYLYCDAAGHTDYRMRRVVRHLGSLPFRTTGTVPVGMPMVVHKNHLVGWCIDGAAAALYAHTLSRLARLRSKRLKTLLPSNAIIFRTYYEWDSWREASMEPGWSWYQAAEEVANGILDGRMTFDDLRSSATEVA
ncbi:hypothetical protein ERJ75_000338400 [Trypanosoma vivax]|uniref:Uncharacterized protein n=1 Tax=Trypanosoma vivax (strain Y486) TaxID=1055687 RepID=F9WKY5_TRYVY|nr:hypothetical protein ERJ75_000338400 [Trypanosoma vivax]CCD18168.1 hypothetical protein, conserved [Trypanosoma vivax Y486]|eukprot:CCD18168.1 hypothetical protein, conserved [Trypanosoma vivax Y486]